jgi:hypothetical protein
MKLCVAALDTDLPLEEATEFLDHIEHAATKMPKLLDDLEAVAPEMFQSEAETNQHA